MEFELIFVVKEIFADELVIDETVKAEIEGAREFNNLTLMLVWADTPLSSCERAKRV